MTPPRVLVTNDDGVSAPGLAVLAAAAEAAGAQVVIVAPSGERSGSGAAIGSFLGTDDVKIETHRLEGVGVEAYAVDGPPAMCVFTSALGGFGDPPDIVLSGVNPGANTGRSTLHSGTVGAVLTAANLGLKGAAFSTDVEWGRRDPEAPVPITDLPVEYEAVASVVGSVLRYLIDAPPKTALNVNGPNGAWGAHKGIRTATLAPFGRVRARLHRDGELLTLDLESVDLELPPESDSALVEEGYVAVTPLLGVTAAPDDVGGAIARLDGEA